MARRGCLYGIAFSVVARLRARRARRREVEVKLARLPRLNYTFNFEKDER